MYGTYRAYIILVCMYNIPVQQQVVQLIDCIINRWVPHHQQCQQQLARPWFFPTRVTRATMTEQEAGIVPSPRRDKMVSRVHPMGTMISIPANFSSQTRVQSGDMTTGTSNIL